VAQTKSICDMYRVYRDGEFATICVADWVNEKDNQKTSFGGEILVNSSFGAFCHTWSNCAIPFKQFLQRISFDSFMQKCLGAELQIFDGEASLNRVKQALLALRRSRLLDAESAEERWTTLVYLSDVVQNSEESFYRELYDFCESCEGLREPEFYVVKSHSLQAIGFWQQLWPIFQSMLESELNAATLPEEK